MIKTLKNFLKLSSLKAFTIFQSVTNFKASSDIFYRHSQISALIASRIHYTATKKTNFDKDEDEKARAKKSPAGKS